MNPSEYLKVFLTMAYYTVLLTFFLVLEYVNAQRSGSGCEVAARTQAGRVCGSRRLARNNRPYASFRGVPYAKQPLGELRFQELQPPELWDGFLDATTEGPVCPNHDIIYGPLMQPQGVSEACIHANIHVPMHALPNSRGRGLRNRRRHNYWGRSQRRREGRRGLPIIVFIHGGSWITGSGDADLNGPEYLVAKDVIVINFNYRLDVFGFLTLNTTKIPGNNALRDQITLLRWVQDNARHFGGNPREVTLAGQSAGATCAHLLTVSPATVGLFQRVWLMSGTAMESFYSASPLYSQTVTNVFLSLLGLNSTDYEEVHDHLVQMPLEKLMEASRGVLDNFGISSFGPVVESPLPGVTAIIDDDPENLVAKGNGNNITMVIGFANNDGEGIRPRLEVFDAVAVYEENPLSVLPPKLLFTLPTEELSPLAERVGARYFGEPPTMDEYVKLCTDSFFAYPSIKVARSRVTSGGAPVFLYKFEYTAEYSALKQAFNLTYQGAGHSEDLSYILKVNSWPVPESSVDEGMKNLMTDLVVNFMKHNDPSRARVSWPAYSDYFRIGGPQATSYLELSDDDRQMVDFYDDITNV